MDFGWLKHHAGANRDSVFFPVYPDHALTRLDEEYFIYSDETDWQYRLWQAGWKVYYLPHVTTVHFGGGSFQPGGRRYTLVYRGRMLFACRHYGRLYSAVQRAMFGVDLSSMRSSVSCAHQPGFSPLRRPRLWPRSKPGWR